jgi:hypothetical protein
VIVARKALRVNIVCVSCQDVLLDACPSARSRPSWRTHALFMMKKVQECRLWQRRRNVVMCESVFRDRGIVIGFGERVRAGHGGGRQRRP